METDLKVIDLEECNLCPFKELEINKNHFSADKPYNSTLYISCVHYKSCKWLKIKVETENYIL